MTNIGKAAEIFEHYIKRALVLSGANVSLETMDELDKATKEFRELERRLDAKAPTAKTVHTPGPWHIRKSYPSGGFDCFWIGPNNASIEVATVNGPQSSEFRESNARLIAAAPDLLEALKEARLQIEYLDEKFSSTGTSRAVLTRIDAALASVGAK